MFPSGVPQTHSSLTASTWGTSPPSVWATWPGKTGSFPRESWSGMSRPSLSRRWSTAMCMYRASNAAWARGVDKHGPGCGEVSLPKPRPPHSGALQGRIGRSSYSVLELYELYINLQRQGTRLDDLRCVQHLTPGRFPWRSTEKAKQCQTAGPFLALPSFPLQGHRNITKTDA